MPSRRQIWLVGGAVTLIAISIGVVFFVRKTGVRTSADPLDEARVFLRPYTPRYRSAPGPYSWDKFTLERQAYLRDEDARMVRALPKANGWTFSRTTMNFPYDVTATATIIPRPNGLVRTLPFLSRFFPSRTRSIRIELIGFKETHGDVDSASLLRSEQGWTHAVVQVSGVSIGVEAPIETKKRVELTPTPTGPGRKSGQ